MNKIKEEIERMGFDAETAHNLYEIVRTTREAAIEECANVCDELRRADYSGENEDWIAGTTDCAKALRALVAVGSMPGAHRTTDVEGV